MVLKKSQSTLEYAALIGVVVAAFLGMQLYFRRGVEGKIRTSADDIGTQFDIESGGYHRVSKLDGQRTIVTVTGDEPITFSDGTTVQASGEKREERYSLGSYRKAEGEEVTTDQPADFNLGEVDVK